MVSENTNIICSALIRQMQLPEDFQQVVSNIYLPLSNLIMQRKQDLPLLVSINGAQGTGKSTMTRFLKFIIESEMKCNVAELSLDDFYLTRKQRFQLADDVHPLFKTRGVPGTHDVAMLERVLHDLLAQKPCDIPRFDKAKDDRCDEQAWDHQGQPVDVILFEGWCNNSPAQDVSALDQAVNELEENEDPQGIWRHHVNEQLIDYQKRVFHNTDMCIMLNAPDFECIYQWRSLQEQKLRSTLCAADKQHSMDEDQLKRFIQHYERVSRHTLKTLPAIADVVLPVAPDHMITGIEQPALSGR